MDSIRVVQVPKASPKQPMASLEPSDYKGLLLTTQRYKLHKMMSGSYQSRSAPTRSPLPLLIHTATKRFTSIPYLIAESFIPQAFNAYRDAKLHEWVSDPFDIPSYVRADAAIYYKHNNWKVGLNFKNITSTRYYESQGYFLRPGAPFAVLGSISVNF